MLLKGKRVPVWMYCSIFNRLTDKEPINGDVKLSFTRTVNTILGKQRSQKLVILKWVFVVFKRLKIRKAT